MAKYLFGLILVFLSLSTCFSQSTIIKYDDTRKVKWDKDFSVIKIKSSKDTAIQLAYFYQSKSKTRQPLIISLHTWSGNYTQVDPLADLIRQKDYNYIHPDFRGANNTPKACCSEWVLSDIDDVINYAIKNADIDTSNIFIIGASGGGYATLSAFMKLKHHVRKYSAWASITDLAAWYQDSKQLHNNYWKDILKCAGTPDGALNTEEANRRSPMYFATPVKKFNNTRLDIFVGVNDGVTGSVPITQSINFYNKLLQDMGVKNVQSYVSADEIQQLLQTRKPLGRYGKIGDRDICLQKTYKNVRLTVFDGTHEMLPEFALMDLVK
jgi:pimeloyl-ACP methyl ester carboxylesterase